MLARFRQSGLAVGPVMNVEYECSPRLFPWLCEVFWACRSLAVSGVSWAWRKLNLKTSMIIIIQICGGFQYINPAFSPLFIKRHSAVQCSKPVLLRSLNSLSVVPGTAYCEEKQLDNTCIGRCVEKARTVMLVLPWKCAEKDLCRLLFNKRPVPLFTRCRISSRCWWQVFDLSLAENHWNRK